MPAYRLSRIRGNPQARRFLERSLENDWIAPVYLFHGPPGVGRLTAAVTFAQALNCEGDIRPCGRCRACRRIPRGLYPDVRFIFPEKVMAGLKGPPEGRRPENWDPTAPITIAQVREIALEVAKRPFEARKRVILFVEGDQLTPEAQNALLKTLEEASAHTVFILIASSPEAVLPTVRSRARQVPLFPLPMKIFAEFFPEVPETELPVLYRIAEGSPGRARQILQDASFAEDRRLVARFFAEGALPDALTLLSRMEEGRARAQQILDLYREMVRDLLALHLKAPETLINRDLLEALEEAKRRLTPADLETLLDLTETVEIGLQRYGNLSFLGAVLLRPLLRNPRDIYEGLPFESPAP